MTDEVISLHPEQELKQFFDQLWKEQVGFVYAPLKSLDETPQFETHFFKWPKQKDDLIEHILKNTDQYECYYGPALYKNPTGPTKDNILGSYTLWTEFDGKLPDISQSSSNIIPSPTLRIRSSKEGHEHYYWYLDHFEEDIKVIEDINRAIAYRLEADTSVWDCTQVLRPPVTNNHKRNKTVRTLSINTNTYSNEDFKEIPRPEQLIKEDIQIESIPDILTIIAKYKWEAEVFDFFRERTKEIGFRSSSLMRLAYYCTEMGMSDEETFSTIYNADERWKKYITRHNRMQCLINIINKVRLKYPEDKVAPVAESKFRFVNWNQLTSLEINIDWLVPGILQKQGLMLITGPPDVGKTQFTLQMLIHLATGKPWINWKIPSKPRKVCFFSMEMSLVELQLIVKNMASNLSQEDLLLLTDNFQFIPIGHGVSMDVSEDQEQIENYLKAEQPEIIVFDSLSVSTRDKLDDERVAKSIIAFADKIRIQYTCSVVYIHHNRKAQVNNKKANTLDDVYGHRILTSQPTTVLGLWKNDPNSKEIELTYLKIRLAPKPKPLTIARSNNLNFVSTSPDSIIQMGEEASKNDRNNQQESSLTEPPFDM